MKTLLAVLLAIAPFALAQEKKLDCSEHDWDRHSYCEMHETTISAQSGITVDGGANGGISVKGWDRSEILVRSQTRVWERDPEEAKRIASEVHVVVSGSHIRTDGPKWNWHDGGWGVSFEIFVPRRTDLTLRTTNGGVDIEDVRGRMDFDTTNGGVKLTRVAGDVEGQTTNGGVHIELAGDHWDGDKCSVTTTNGGVKLLVPANYSAHLEASTTHGGVNIDFPVTVHGRIGSQIETDLGSGGRTIRVRTTNGGISVQRI
ncbi:MAG TPA: DUF4097 family beta strand repeat-containing protein [Bryobacteraceae bacterium]|nr:DUF4097 family beta strand repeat-containing protein [Bryobacteraceae bacterium]